MNNFSTVTNAITLALTKFQAIAESAQSERSYVFKTAEAERDFMIAGGKAKHGLRELANKMAGSIIAKIEDVTTECEIQLSPAKMLNQDRTAPALVNQSLNASLKMVAAHLFVMGGHANALAITTALDNWIEADSIQVELDTADIARKLITNMLNGGLIEQGVANGETGGTFETFGLVPKLQDKRMVLMQDIWDKAPPKMKPMQHPVRWLHDGTCQLPNFKLLKGSSEFNHDFVEAFNLMGHVPYTVNAEIQDELIDWFESVEITEDEDLKDLIEIVQQLIMLPVGIKLYFPHTADWRGRAYARGGLTQFQSVKECRAMLDFFHSVDVTDPTGLYLHVANCFNRDKLSINGRLKWVKENLESIVRGVHDCGIYSIRARLALEEYIAHGTSNIICHIDGTCNGTQWTSAMYRDAETAKYVNVRAASHDDTPHDLYGHVSETAKGLASGDVLRVLNEYNRDIAKGVVMVLGYGASEGTLLTTVQKYLTGKKDSADAKAVTDVLIKAIGIAAPALTKLTRNIKMRLKRDPRHEAAWCVPDLKVKIKNMDDTHLVLYSSMFGGKLSGKAIPDNKAFARGISPNYVHSLDSAHLRAVVRKSETHLSCIHDSVGADANNVIRVNKVIREEFHRLNQVDLVSNLYTQLDMRYKANRGKLDIDEVLQASYIFS